MANEQAAGMSDPELVSKLQAIEAKLQRCEALRKRQRRISLLGVLLILLVLGVFIYRLVEPLLDYRNTLNDPQRRTQLLTQVMNDSQAKVILKREGNILMTDLRTEVLPVLEHALATELDKQLPRVQQEVLNLGARLQQQAETRLQGKLVEALLKSLAGMDADLQKMFGDINEKELEKQINANKQVFVDELHNLIEERLAKVQTSLEVLKTQVAALGAEAKQQGVTLDQSEALFIDALTELLAYELRPELGREPAK